MRKVKFLVPLVFVLLSFLLVSPAIVFAGSGAGVAVKLDAVVVPGQAGGGTGGSGAYSSGACCTDYPVPPKPTVPSTVPIVSSVPSTPVPLVPPSPSPVVFPPEVTDSVTSNFIVPSSLPVAPEPFVLDLKLLLLVGGGLIVLLLVWYGFKNKKDGSVS